MSNGQVKYIKNKKIHTIVRYMKRKNKFYFEWMIHFYEFFSKRRYQLQVKYVVPPLNKLKVLGVPLLSQYLVH